jgi:16S rRNA (uracil1498-N3)-methyltransferase
VPRTFRIFVPPAQIAEPVQLSPAQAHHLETVLRLGPGAELEVFDGRGSRWPARLEARGTLRLGPPLEAEKGALDVWLAQSLAAGEKLDLVVQKATELGVSRIVPLAAERSVVRLDAARGERRAERLRRIAQESARQCCRASVPAIDLPRSLAGLAELLADEPERRAVLLDPAEGELRLSQAARGAARILIAVGPEGGFTARERALATSAGFLAASLGRLVLRTETAGLAALSVLQHLHGDLG